MAQKSTPAHVQQVRGYGERIAIFRDELIQVQSLYLERRYKQCAALCETLQRPEIHPIHQAFLWFYHATCYESLGTAAHNFSRKKLPFLEQARDGLNMALTVLPLPYATTRYGTGAEEEDHSPMSSRFPRRPTYGRFDVVIDPEPRTPSTCKPELSASASFDSVYSVQTCGSGPKTPQQSPPKSPLFEPEPDSFMSEPQQHQQQFLTPTSVSMSSHTERLTKSLSTTHNLDEELVPSPLFSRSRKTPSIYAETLDTDRPHPLPPLPFNHRSHFRIQGTRVVQMPHGEPMRKTAVQTLIARFEGSLPLPPSPTFFTTTRSPLGPSPITPRFQAIKDAFSPDPHNGHLEAYLRSASLGQYHASLADFRASLRGRVTALDGQIAQVHAAQLEHAASKTLSQTRLASFWSFDHAATRQPPSLTRDEGDPSAAARRARVERLRSEGWAVGKERHGFKGERHYEHLRQTVERELEAYASRVARLA